MEKKENNSNNNMHNIYEYMMMIGAFFRAMKYFVVSLIKISFRKIYKLTLNAYIDLKFITCLKKITHTHDVNQGRKTILFWLRESNVYTAISIVCIGSFYIFFTLTPLGAVICRHFFSGVSDFFVYRRNHNKFWVIRLRLQNMRTIFSGGC
jgi:hypothetical protein